MTHTEFELNYPATSGFSKTIIHFYDGTPNLNSLFSNEARRLLVTDTNVSNLPSMKSFIGQFAADKELNSRSSSFVACHGQDVLLVLGAGEKYKTMESVLAIVKTALDFNFDRHCVFIAIGGGVICDMTGFAASIFKRGVAVEFVPTTLLAMVDASIGGKTGCDFEGYKNMIGSFYPASKLHIWSDFVQTLPANEYRSGLAEAVKTALLFSPELFNLFENSKQAIQDRECNAVNTMIKTCVQAKAAIVQEDFKELNKRALLNYGHAFGHALESVAGLGAVTHGDAVAWGMSRALDLSASLGLCDLSFSSSVKKLLSWYGWDTNAIPACLSSKSPSGKIAEDLIKAMHKDKKNSDGSMIRVIVQKAIADNVIMETNESNILQVLTK